MKIVDCDVVMDGIREGWEEFFETLPPLGEAFDDDYWKINWNAIRSLVDGRVQDARQVAVSETVSAMVSSSATIDLGEAGCIGFSKARQNAAQLRILKDLHAARLKSRIEKGAFVLCATGEEEMKTTVQLPFSLAKVLADCDEDPPAGTKIKIHWYWQGSGNPNLAFVAGVLSGSGQKPWTAEIPRESVLLINPTFKANNLTLKSDSLKSLESLRHKCLVGWKHRATFGLVFENPIWDLKSAEIGSTLVCPIKEVPQGVHRSGQKHQVSVTPLVSVPVTAEVGVDAAGVSMFEGNWFVPVSGDPNGLFKVVTLAASATAKHVKQAHATVLVSTVRLSDVAQYMPTVLGSVSAGFRLSSEALEDLSNVSRFYFMRGWSSNEGRLVKGTGKSTAAVIRPPISLPPIPVLGRGGCSEILEPTTVKSASVLGKRKSRVAAPKKSSKSTTLSVSKSSGARVVVVGSRKSGRASKQPRLLLQDAQERLSRTGELF
jgi:hypothetical protein